MEFALNVVWLLMSGVALGLWAWTARARRLTRTEALSGVIVIVCSLVLLFPVISATDDLHANSAAVEDSFSAARKMKPAIPATVSQVQPLALLAALLLTTVSARKRSITLTEPLLTATSFVREHTGLSPPAISLA